MGEHMERMEKRLEERILYAAVYSVAICHHLRQGGRSGSSDVPL